MTTEKSTEQQVHDTKKSRLGIVALIVALIVCMAIWRAGAPSEKKSQVYTPKESLTIRESEAILFWPDSGFLPTETAIQRSLFNLNFYTTRIINPGREQKAPYSDFLGAINTFVMKCALSKKELTKKHFFGDLRLWTMRDADSWVIQNLIYPCYKKAESKMLYHGNAIRYTRWGGRILFLDAPIIPDVNAQANGKNIENPMTITTRRYQGLKPIAPPTRGCQSWIIGVLAGNTYTEETLTESNTTSIGNTIKAGLFAEVVETSVSAGARFSTTQSKSTTTRYDSLPPAKNCPEISDVPR